MTYEQALALAIDGCAQQAALNRSSGRLDGLADLQDQACKVLTDALDKLTDEHCKAASSAVLLRNASALRVC